MSDKWCVHVVGPDSVLPARSFKYAVSECHKINKMIISRNEIYPPTEYHPVSWAKVEMWPDKLGEHKPEDVDWNDIY